MLSMWLSEAQLQHYQAEGQSCGVSGPTLDLRKKISEEEPRGTKGMNALTNSPVVNNFINNLSIRNSER